MDYRRLVCTPLSFVFLSHQFFADQLLHSKRNVSQAEFSQPLCAALQIALYNLLAAWNIHPSAIIGHSSGEIAAAYAAKSISMEAAITSAYYRGLIKKLQTRPGAMAAVGLGREAVHPYLTKGVVIACDNSPNATTLSGDEATLEAVLRRLREEQPDVFTRRLRIEMAGHSRKMLIFLISVPNDSVL